MQRPTLPVLLALAFPIACSDNSNDRAVPHPADTLEEINVDESVQTISIELRIDPAPMAAFEATLLLSGDAELGEDFNLPRGTFLVPAGSTEVLVDVEVVDDDRFERLERVELGLAEAASLDRPPLGPIRTLAIADDDPLPIATFSSTPISLVEGSGPVIVSVTLDRASGVPGGVQVSGLGAPFLGGDVEFSPQRLLFAPGQTHASFEILAVGDDATEGDERGSLALSSLHNVEVGTPALLTVSIADRLITESVLFTTADTTEVEEARRRLLMPIARVNGAPDSKGRLPQTPGGSGKAIEIHYELSGTSEGGADYVVPTGSVIIPAGSDQAVLEIELLDDGQVETEESLIVTLVSTSTGAAIGSPARQSIRILDNDVDPEVLYTAPRENGLAGVFAGDTLGSATVEVALADSVDGTVLDFSRSPKGPEVAVLGSLRIPGTTELFATDWPGAPLALLSGQLTPGGDVHEYRWSPDGRSIAYLADGELNGKDELFVARLEDDSGIRVSQVAPIGGDVIEFAWSPDGQQLAYLADAQEDATFELFTVAPDGSDHARVSASPTPSGDVVGSPGFAAFEWSPDSARLAYRGDVEENDRFELFTVAPDGSNHERVSSTLAPGGDVEDFGWSADSRQVAFRADREVDNRLELYGTAPDGTELVRLSGPMVPTGDVAPGLWRHSPDSRHVAYVADQEGNVRDELFVSAMDGSDNLRVSQVAAAGEGVRAFAWAPDSAALAFTFASDGTTSKGLFATDPQSAKVVTLSGSGETLTFAWSPLSDRIVSVAQATPQLSVVLSIDPESGKAILLASQLDAVPEAQWSADGARVVYRTHSGDGLYELFSSPPNQTGASYKVSSDNLGPGGVAAFRVD